MTEPKPRISLRISQTANDLLRAMAARRGITITAFLEQTIRELARKESA